VTSDIFIYLLSAKNHWLIIADELFVRFFSGNVWELEFHGRLKAYIAHEMEVSL
jgi:hypothetical protein